MVRTRRWWAVLAVATLLAAGCGDDTADDALGADDATDAVDDVGTDDGDDGQDDADSDEDDDETSTDTDEAAANTDDVDPEVAEACALVADALGVGSGSLTPGDAATELLATQPPAGITEALDTIVAIDNGQDVLLSEGDVNERLQGYYGFCSDVAAADLTTTADAPASCAFPPPVDFYYVDGIPANDPDGGLVVREAPGASSPQVGVFPQGTEVQTTGACTTIDGRDWWVVETFELFGWVSTAFLSSGEDFGFDPDTGEPTAVSDADELGISCFYKFDQAACDAYGFDNPAVQGPTDLLEAGCRESTSRRTLECAELVATRGVTFDDATAALQSEIMAAAGLRCEEGVESFVVPELHSVACTIGQISPN